MIELRTLLNEIDSEAAVRRVDNLPKGRIFDDAKNIESVFDKSRYSWSEAIEQFEKNSTQARTTKVKLSDITITQPNIQRNKVVRMIQDVSNLPQIDAIEFPDEIVVFDGHHRLITQWALGYQNIKLNLAKSIDFD